MLGLKREGWIPIYSGTDSSVDIGSEPEDFRCGIVAIIGRTNVGKSSLLNSLIGQKLAIVTPKPHTTRQRLLGVLHGDTFQAGVLDTPGFLAKGKDVLDASMARQSSVALAEADLVLLVVEPRIPGNVEEHFMEQITKLKTRAILVVNKADTVSKTKLLPIIESYSQRDLFAEIIPISIAKEDGLELLLNLLHQNLPWREPQFPSEMVTDRSINYLAAEIIREKIFILYGMEIPYFIAVEIEELERRQNERPDYVRATIYVEKPSQKKLLIGREGDAIKRVSVLARIDIEELLERKVFLELWVKVKPKWRNKSGFIQQLV